MIAQSALRGYRSAESDVLRPIPDQTRRWDAPTRRHKATQPGGIAAQRDGHYRVDAPGHYSAQWIRRSGVERLGCFGRRRRGHQSRPSGRRCYGPSSANRCDWHQHANDRQCHLCFTIPGGGLRWTAGGRDPTRRSRFSAIDDERRGRVRHCKRARWQLLHSCNTHRSRHWTLARRRAEQNKLRRRPAARCIHGDQALEQPVSGRQSCR